MGTGNKSPKWVPPVTLELQWWGLETEVCYHPYHPRVKLAIFCDYGWQNNCGDGCCELNCTPGKATAWKKCVLAVYVQCVQRQMSSCEPAVFAWSTIWLKQVTNLNVQVSGQNLLKLSMRCSNSEWQCLCKGFNEKPSVNTSSLYFCNIDYALMLCDYPYEHLQSQRSYSRIETISMCT